MNQPASDGRFAAPGHPVPPGGGFAGPKPRRFAGKGIAYGVLGSWALLLLPLLASWLVDVIPGFVWSPLLGSRGVVSSAGLVAVLGPWVLGGFLVASGSPLRRGIGLGLFIGWGLGIVIGAGVCVAALAVLLVA